MIHHITDFDFVVVDTELDAFIARVSIDPTIPSFYNRQMNYFSNYNYVHITNKDLY